VSGGNGEEDRTGGEKEGTAPGMKVRSHHLTLYSESVSFLPWTSLQRGSFALRPEGSSL
jgi:hypothetical protein